MFQGMPEQIQFGLAAFAGMTVVLLLIFRLTRQNAAIRGKIKWPLFVAFFLLTLYDILYLTSTTLPPVVEAYFYALLYLSIAILLIRILILFFFDIFLVRNKKYRAPQLLKEITTVVLFGIVLVIIIQDTLKIQV